MTSPVKLWLFDIDGTLVDTGGAGMRALQEAALHCFGDQGPALDLAGSTDSGIVRGMFEHFGREPDETAVEGFYGHYLERLELNLKSEEFSGRALSGSAEMLDQLASREDVTIGLLTGNIEAGAMIKMRHYELAHHFHFGAYGCDHHDRNQLGPVALERAADFAGRPFSADETLVIGDTPKDIACAAAVGARCLAVATGAFEADGLVGADRVVSSLEDPAGWADYLDRSIIQA